MEAFQKFGFNEKKANIIQDVPLTSDLNPAFFGAPAAIKEHFSTYLQELAESPKANGATRIYTDGEKEVAAVKRILENGVPVNDNTMMEVLNLCNYLELDFGKYFGDHGPPVKEDVFKGNY